jgi:glycogen debranching enzyme
LSRFEVDHVTLPAADQHLLHHSIGQIVAGYRAGKRFLSPLREHLNVAGLGHISEVADAEPPHRPGGCPFQAWSLGELLRVSGLVAEQSAEEIAPPAQPRARAAV